MTKLVAIYVNVPGWVVVDIETRKPVRFYVQEQEAHEGTFASDNPTSFLPTSFLVDDKGTFFGDGADAVEEQVAREVVNAENLPVLEIER